MWWTFDNNERENSLLWILVIMTTKFKQKMNKGFQGLLVTSALINKINDILHSLFWFQWDQQILAPLEALHGELRQICKTHSNSLNQLKISFEGEWSATFESKFDIKCVCFRRWRQFRDKTKEWSYNENTDWSSETIRAYFRCKFNKKIADIMSNLAPY